MIIRVCRPFVPSLSACQGPVSMLWDDSTISYIWWLSRAPLSGPPSSDKNSGWPTGHIPISVTYTVVFFFNVFHCIVTEASISWIDSKLSSFMIILTVGKSQKSHGGRFCKQGRWHQKLPYYRSVQNTETATKRHERGLPELLETVTGMMGWACSNWRKGISKGINANIFHSNSF